MFESFANLLLDLELVVEYLCKSLLPDICSYMFQASIRRSVLSHWWPGHDGAWVDGVSKQALEILWFQTFHHSWLCQVQYPGMLPCFYTGTVKMSSWGYEHVKPLHIRHFYCALILTIFSQEGLAACKKCLNNSQ